jgi:hypothetical protein
MKFVKMLALAATAVAALSIATGTASATVLTSPAGTTYTGAVKASGGTVYLHGSFTTISCFRSSLELGSSAHGAATTAGGKLSNLTFTECNFPVKVLKAGSMEFHALSGGSGSVTWNGAEITVETSIANCVFTPSQTQFTFWGGNFPYIKTGATLIPRTGHSFFCGSTGQYTAEYRVSSPSSLSVD